MAPTDVHRILKPGATGQDVKKLQQAISHRLGALGLDSLAPKVDGVNGPETRRTGRLALESLGALPETRGKVSEPGFLQAMQRMIRFPGRRSSEQVRRAQAWKRSEEYRLLRAAEPGMDPGGSGAPAARARALAAIEFAVARAPRHYTQGSRRWDPIESGARPGGPMWSYADCSSFATWVIWYALGMGAGPDVVNGCGWEYGYTGTMLNHGQVLNAPSLPGDCVIYGQRGSTGAHTAVYKGGGLVASHGSEGGPYTPHWQYRGDVMSVRRYI